MSTRDSNSSNGGQNAELLIDEADRTHRFWVLKGQKKSGVAPALEKRQLNYGVACNLLASYKMRQMTVEIVSRLFNEWPSLKFRHFRIHVDGCTMEDKPCI